jgi:subtilisin family serine protease
LAKAVELCAQTFSTDVISCSVGVRTGAFDELIPLKNVIEAAHQAGRAGNGTLVVWADFDTHAEIQPNSLEDYKGIICVGPADTNGDRLPDSGYGAGLDLLAPGDAVTCLVYSGGVSGTGQRFGASCSAPIVAGVAALVLSVDQTLKWDVLTDLILKSCDPPTTGKTRIDNERGWGTLNALNAVTAAAPLIRSFSIKAWFSRLLSTARR